ncbi:M1 family metallopeptidase [Sphingomonas quercus]|uniref:M1 family metallopeptidase n=1 Tax=Sphingomonas quercus TaxID=2842451 RepID=A0ABS6BEV7_9SPHN|nr:M1 family metallopeptidase [Sphingomonas quercus]MBU3076838.1 M1 family metallopeptidase [Sphingomonas quercus]
MIAIVLALAGGSSPSIAAQTAPAAAQGASQAPRSPRIPSRADFLSGEYGRYRANNDLLSYQLSVRVDPDRKKISGTNKIRFKMLQDDTRIQLNLSADLNVNGIRLGSTPLKYERDLDTVYVDFPKRLLAGTEYSIDFDYSGSPRETGRFGGLAFRKDPKGRQWINTAGDSLLWWPNKDQWRDEVEWMDISVAIPNGLVDVSNGKFVGKTRLPGGYTRWDWHVHYPINNYDVSLNIGSYIHFEDRLGDLPIDFYVLPESIEGARRQFAQARPMIEIFQKYFGEYPFVRDGYKLIEAPYSGMEHQSAVTYGNHFANGYLERDWTGVGISPLFDFIIIHESGHEWFGNAVSAADISDMWIQEGWDTYLEELYVEARWGRDAASRYINGYKPKVRNEEPIVTQRGVHSTPSQDQYFKSALFLHTLRNVIDDDTRWFAMLRAMFQRFKYRNIMTEDMVEFINAQLGRDLTPIFNQYLRRAALPTLELAFNASDGTLAYRWDADERDFAMPIRVTAAGQPLLLEPTTAWKIMPMKASRDAVEVATDVYYINVKKYESR